MGIKAALKPNGVSKKQNGNAIPMIAIGRKRALTFVSASVLPNNRRLSQAALQRIFIIMMGIVFFMWSTLTIVLVRRGQNTIFEEETQQGTYGPPSIHQDKNKILREHIANLRKDRNDKINAVQSDEKQQHKDSIDSVKNSLAQKDRIKVSPAANFDMEEVDIHGMIHPGNNKKAIDSLSKSTYGILKAYLEPIHLDDWKKKTFTC